MTRWATRTVGLILACAAFAVILADGAVAAIPTDYCKDKTREAVVKRYNRGELTVPLRCGTDSWGFDHIVLRGRWSDGFSSQIAQTISRGTMSRDGTVYATFDADCNELFRIIVNPGALHGTGFSPQGIITAYYITPVTMETGRRVSSPSPDGQCLITEPVSDTEGTFAHELDA